MKMRTRFEASLEKRQALKDAEELGVVADNHAYRVELMKRVTSGEITLQDAQMQLKKVQKDAKKNGMKTRSQVFSAG